MKAQISYEAAYTAALLLETEAKSPTRPKQQRFLYARAAEAFWSIINDTDAIELEGSHHGEEG